MVCNGCGRLLLIRVYGFAFVRFSFSFFLVGMFLLLVFKWIGIGTAHMGRVIRCDGVSFYSLFLVFMVFFS